MGKIIYDPGSGMPVGTTTPTPTGTPQNPAPGLPTDSKPHRRPRPKKKVNYTARWWALSPGARQRILREQGYNIGSNPSEGPGSTTFLASRALARGISSSYWNKVHSKTMAHNRAANAKSKGADKGVLDAASTDSGIDIGDDPTAGGTVYAPEPPTAVPNYYGKVQPPNNKAPYKGLQNFFLNPQKWAQAAANETYNPQINQLSREMVYNRAQKDSDTKQIADWWNQILGTHQEGVNRNAREDPKAVGDFESMAQNIAALTGDPNSVAKIGGIYAGNLRADARAQGDFDRRMTTVLTAEGAEIKTKHAQDMDNARTEMLQKLLDLKGAKGAAIAKALQEGNSQRFDQGLSLANARSAAGALGFDQSLGLANAKTGAAGLGVQITGQKLDNQMKRAGMNPNYWSNVQDRKTAWRNFQISRASLAQQVEEAGGKKGFDNLDPKDRSTYTQGIKETSGIQGTIPPNRVNATYGRMSRNVRSYVGWNVGNPRVKQWMANIIAPHLPPGWHIGPNGFPTNSRKPIKPRTR